MTHNRQDSIGAEENRHFQTYVSFPERPNGHAVIVLQEIFGVNATIRALADRYAAAGYLALAPDLYWRIEPGVELGYSQEDVAKAFGYLERFDEDAAVRDIGRCAAHARALTGGSGRVAALGLCLGGKLAFLAAARLDLDAAVSFYGVGIEDRLDEAAALRCPLMLHYGDRDRYADAQAVARIEAALPRDGRAALYRYPDVGHGFYTRENSPQADLAHGRTADFLRAALSGTAP